MDVRASEIELFSKTRQTVAQFGQDPNNPGLETGPLVAAFTKILVDCFEDVRKKTDKKYAESKTAYYLSMEYLPGAMLPTAIAALGRKLGIDNVQERIDEVLKRDGLSLKQMIDHEPDPGMGNGGLGRLAYCLADSATNLKLPVVFYGLVVRNGLFKQTLNGLRQEVQPDSWRQYGSGWLRREQNASDWKGKPLTVLFDRDVSVPVSVYNFPVISNDGKNVNTLRLFEAPSNYTNPNGTASGEDLANYTRRISDRLYPPDGQDDGKKLRLMQEAFLSISAVQDIVRRHLANNATVDNLSDTTAIHINDTHPALAIAELMRTLTKDHDVSFDRAVQITRATCNYTNHTLAPEALEKFDKRLLEYVSPGLRKTIEEMQERVLEEVDEKFANLSDDGRNAVKHEASLIDGNYIRMGHMAAIFANRVNGVSALHSKLVEKELFPFLQQLRKGLQPSGVEIANDEHMVINITNGITPRLWVGEANPALADMFTEVYGTAGWKTNLMALDEALANVEADSYYLGLVGQIKRDNKKNLADYVQNKLGVAISPNALFDVQCKRQHGYKRQFLNLLHTVSLYQDILEHPEKQRPDTVKIFAGLAFPGYRLAEDCVTLSNWLAQKINNDPKVGDKLKVVFIPGYNVSVAKKLIPAADISEQISLAGMEASGTSDFKFSINGALTMGTHDGSIIEMSECAENGSFPLFGMKKAEVDEVKKLSCEDYQRRFVCGEGNITLDKALHYLATELLKDPDADIRRMAYMAEDILNGRDEWKIAADFKDYCRAQDAKRALYLTPEKWNKVAIRQMRAASHFSIDRTMHLYASDIWNIRPVLAPDAVKHKPLRGSVPLLAPA